MSNIGTNADAAVTDPTAAATLTSIAKGLLSALITAGVGAVSTVLGATTDAAVITDAVGTISGKARGIVTLIAAMSAKLPASLGIKAAAASLSVTQATEDAARSPASLGSKADAASLPVTQSTEDKAVLAAQAANIVKLEARIAQPLLTAAPAILSIGTSTSRTTGLTVGTVYAVYASAPCWIKIGNDAVEAAATDVYLEPGMVFCWTPTADNTDDGVACIGSVAGGKVYVQACQA